MWDSLLIGYFIAYFSFFPFIRRHRAIRSKNPNALQPEARLYWLLYGKDAHRERGVEDADVIASGSTGNDWTVGLCMDQLGTSPCSVDRAVDFRHAHWHRECKILLIAWARDGRAMANRLDSSTPSTWPPSTT